MISLRGILRTDEGGVQTQLHEQVDAQIANFSS